MLMIKAIVRPEKSNIVLAELNSAGFPGVTKIDVVGRGKQKGIRIGDVVYDELPKEMILLVIRNEDKDDVVNIISKYAKSGEKGTYGDGKIFVSPVEEVYTISSGKKEN
ncbi:MAG: nitrogen fixation protein NifHD [Gracilibacter sp. BRH_c7a]|nr:MAG: nitrogen fixation protein NifHD [Gracilibacter sp. BRH_c7a]